MTKNREIAEHECEERAMEEATRLYGNSPDLAKILSEIDGGETDRLASALTLFAPHRNSTDNQAAVGLRKVLFALAYRRALTAERRKEGLE